MKVSIPLLFFASLSALAKGPTLPPSVEGGLFDAPPLPSLPEPEAPPALPPPPPEPNAKAKTPTDVLENGLNGKWTPRGNKWIDDYVSGKITDQTPQFPIYKNTLRARARSKDDGNNHRSPFIPYSVNRVVTYDAARGVNTIGGWGDLLLDASHAGSGHDGHTMIKVTNSAGAPFGIPAGYIISEVTGSIYIESNVLGKKLLTKVGQIINSHDSKGFVIAGGGGVKWYDTKVTSTSKGEDDYHVVLTESKNPPTDALPGAEIKGQRQAKDDFQVGTAPQAPDLPTPTPKPVIAKKSEQPKATPIVFKKAEGSDSDPCEFVRYSAGMLAYGKVITPAHCSSFMSKYYSCHPNGDSSPSAPVSKVLSVCEKKDDGAEEREITTHAEKENTQEEKTEKKTNPPIPKPNIDPQHKPEPKPPIWV